MQKQPWIGKPAIDTLFVLLPPFLSIIIILLFPTIFMNNKEMSTASWFVLVLLIDVGHVYSTLYRTYFDPVTFKKQKTILTTIPLIGFIVSVIVYTLSSVLFWRILAYVAVYHFVRQQYGFMRVYSRKEKNNITFKVVDTISVYYATLYPLLYWHLNGPRNFNWFIDGDFFYTKSDLLLKIATILYVTVIAVYFFCEIIRTIRNKFFNIPKFMIISGTILSWYFGIVYFNGDMAFTLLNVISHGVPYIALIWIYGNKNYTQQTNSSRFLQLLFSRNGILLFMGIIFLFAYIEEGIWDYTLWKEHASIFNFTNFPTPEFNDQALSLLIPLLALPQITHYILDGFIWRIRKEEFRWNNEIK